MTYRFFITLILAIGYSQSMHSMDAVAAETAALSPEIQKLNAELLSAVYYDDECTCRLLIDLGAQVDAKDPTGWTALMYAANRNHRSICRLLIDRGAQINLKTTKGNTALLIAAYKGHRALCMILIDHGAQLNDDLITAGRYENPEIIQLLLTLNAQINTKTPENLTALMVAAYYSRESTCRLLIDYGADIKTKNDQGRTALGSGARNGTESTCRTLITYPTFNPSLSPEEFQISRKRIFTALCAFNRYCPQLPIEMCFRILCGYYPELKQDFLNSAACGIHKNQHNKTPFLPLRVVRLLLQNGKLDADATVEAIKAHHIVSISPLMFEAIPHAQTSQMRALLNPDTLEQNFSWEIERTIRTRLGLPMDNPVELIPPQCLLQ